MSRIQRRTFALIAALAAPLVMLSVDQAREGSTGQASAGHSAGSKSYHVVHGWPVLPEGFMFGHVTGVGMDSHNHLFVFHRADHSILGTTFDQPISSPVVMCFDAKTGQLLNSWGAGTFLIPHGLRVDQQDNVWVTDIQLHQVLKFSHEGKLLMAVGERGVPGLDGAHFNKPTDIAVAPDGSFYVSDGYGNSRVAKFAPDGKFILDWGHIKMRWEYEKPEQDLFLVDGKTAWFYVPGDHTVTRIPAKQSTDFRTPLALLAGEMKVSRVCARVAMSDALKPQADGNAVVRCALRGEPQDKNRLEENPSASDEVFFEVTPDSGNLARIIVRQPGGIEVEFRFQNWEFNPPISADRFRFDPPAGVAIVNGELPAGDKSMNKP